MMLKWTCLDKNKLKTKIWMRTSKIMQFGLVLTHRLFTTITMLGYNLKFSRTMYKYTLDQLLLHLASFFIHLLDRTNWSQERQFKLKQCLDWEIDLGLHLQIKILLSCSNWMHSNSILHSSCLFNRNSMPHLCKLIHNSSLFHCNSYLNSIKMLPSNRMLHSNSVLHSNRMLQPKLGMKTKSRLIQHPSMSDTNLPNILT